MLQLLRNQIFTMISLFTLGANWVIFRGFMCVCSTFLLALVIYFFIRIILTGLRWYIIVVLVCMFFMITEVEHLFMYLFTIYMSLEKFLSDLLPIFNQLVFLLLSCKSSLYILDISPLIDNIICKYFLSIYKSSSFWWWCPFLCRTFLVWYTHIFSLLLFPLPWEAYPLKYQQDWCQWDYCVCFLPWFLWFQVLRLGL